MKLEDYNISDFDYFVSLIAPAVKRGSEQEIARRLLTKYLTVENIFCVDTSELSAVAGENCAVFLKLVAAIVSRRKTDLFEFGRVHTRAELADYFKALFIGASVETVYVICFDSRGRTVSCELIGTGTVNRSEIVPRRIVEIAVRSGAKSVALAHNHPRGVAKPSEEDALLTERLAKTLSDAGVELREHYIVAGQLCTVYSPC